MAENDRSRHDPGTPDLDDLVVVHLHYGQGWIMLPKSLVSPDCELPAGIQFELVPVVDHGDSPTT